MVPQFSLNSQCGMPMFLVRHCFIISVFTASSDAIAVTRNLVLIAGSTVPSPPPPPPPPPAPPLMANGNGGGSALALPEIDKDRSALLGAICKFNKASLRKTKVN
jgi:hypothetical protein